MNKIIESLSPMERQIVPHLNLPLDEIIKKSNLDKTSVLRALQFLENKKLLFLKQQKEILIILGTNGIYYLKNHLPERNLLLLLEKNNHLPLEEAKKLSKLSDNEFKAAIGVLKRKAMINLSNGKISTTASKEEIVKKFPEEKLLESLPKKINSLSDEERFAFENLKSRKEIIELEEKKTILFHLTDKGKEIAGKKIDANLIEEVTPEMIKTGIKGKKFRRYDIHAKVPKIFGGKRHFVNQSIEKARRIWLDMGFKEMTGSFAETSFWNFDALFTAQDHPVRDMHDTFFIKNLEGRLPHKEILFKIKKSHEQGVDKSKGWQYVWKEENAKKVILRTHTTSLSARKLAKITKKDLPGKYFAIGKVFRNETLDWSHGFEFNQSEGIVIDPNANFRHLIGYLKQFYSKMGFDEIKVIPSYFPYTEPSLEIYAYNKEKEKWVEIGGAGIFRPEVTIPLLGEAIPVLAWGPGFDRLMMKSHSITDLRDLYKNDLRDLREKKVLVK